MISLCFLLFISCILCNPIVQSPLSDQISNFGDSFVFTIPHDTFKSGNDFGISVTEKPDWLIGSVDAPSPIGEYSGTGTTYYNVAISGDFAYVTDYSGDGLVIIDVSNPMNPTYKNNTDSWGAMEYNLVIQGKYLYLSKPKIYDISNPTSPELVGYASCCGVAKDVSTVGNYSFFPVGSAGIKIVDHANPAAPVQVGGAVSTPGWAEGIYSQGNVAYVADNNRLTIMNITYPETPVLIQSLPLVGQSYDVFVVGDYAYVAAGSNGLTIVNVSDVTNPVQVGNVDFPGVSYGVFVSGNYAYLAAGGNLKVVDVRDVENPTLAFDVAAGNSKGVYIDGGLVYVASGVPSKLYIFNHTRNINIKGNCTLGGLNMIEVTATDVDGSVSDNFTVDCQCPSDECQNGGNRNSTTCLCVCEGGWQGVVCSVNPETSGVTLMEKNIIIWIFTILCLLFF